MIIPHGFVTDIPVIDLYEDTWVCLVAEDNDEVGERHSMDDLSCLPWVVAYNTQTPFTPAVRQLRTIGIELKVQIVIESFVAVPFLVPGTKRRPARRRE